MKINTITTTRISTVRQIAAEYLTLSTDFTDYELSAWTDLSRWNWNNYAAAAELAGITEMSVRPGQPYANAHEQAAAMATGELVVSSDHCEHPIWSPAQNITYRAVHDLVGHREHNGYIPPFTIAGELAAWNRQRAFMIEHEAVSYTHLTLPTNREV